MEDGSLIGMRERLGGEYGVGFQVRAKYDMKLVAFLSCPERVDCPSP